MFSPFLPGAAPPAALFGYWLPGTATEWAATAIAAFIFGNILFAIGSNSLDWYYDEYYKHWRRRRLNKKADPEFEGPDTDQLHALAEGKRPHEIEQVTDGTAGVYDWCLSYLEVHAPGAALEVDRLQAQSKLFRSLCVLIVFVWLCNTLAWLFFRLPWPAHGLGVGIVSLIALMLCLWRFLDLRFICTRRVYEFFLVARISGAGTEHQ